MPLYEYVCSQCKSLEEHLVLNKKDTPTKCKKCGGKLKQVISQSSFQLKGDGWYKSSYQNKGSKKKKDGQNDK